MSKMNKTQRKNYLKKLIKGKPEFKKGKYLAINEDGQILVINDENEKIKHKDSFDIYDVKADLEDNKPTK